MPNHWVYGCFNEKYKNVIDWNSCKLIFLDIDGVLNHFYLKTYNYHLWDNVLMLPIQYFTQNFSMDYLEKLYIDPIVEPCFYPQIEFIDKEKLNILAKLQNSMPNLYFVITSNWRLSFSIEILEKLLLYPLKILGTTSALTEVNPTSNKNKFYRSDEVRHWLMDFYQGEIVKLAILEDDVFLYGQDVFLKDFIVLTDMETGLLESQMALILKNLAKVNNIKNFFIADKKDILAQIESLHI